MTPMDDVPSRDVELAGILELYGRDRIESVMGVMERQLGVLMNRAQLLLGLCGIAITTTGFSGRLIAGTDRLAQWLIVSGLALVLLSACVLVWGVLHVRWMTQQQGKTIEKWLAAALEYRDRKTQHYRVAIVLLLIGLAMYVGAISVMLLNPVGVTVPTR
jgi:hypothetical protein